jgi:DNA (cytosine-5)-methyltransferase 1
LLATKHLLGWRTVCYVEWDKYAVEVLKARIRDGYLDDAPIWDDAFTFDGRPWAGCVDIITAGFPCQPFSSAGKGLAELDPRNGWPAVIRILREIRPRYALLENVPRLLSKPYYRRILSDLAEAGFDCEQDCITAEEMGAPHIRERLWIVAHANLGKSKLAKQSWQEIIHTEWHGIAQQVANPNSERFQKQWRPVTASSDKERVFPDLEHGSQWSVEPELGRVVDGMANRVDRLRALGNGQVPAVVEEAWERLGGDDDEAQR